MKRIIYFLALTMIIFSCGKEPEQNEQTITSLNVDATTVDITATSVFLKGTYEIVPVSIKPDAVGFYYGTDELLLTYDEIYASKVEDEFYVEINDLLPETTYYFRAFVKVKDVIRKSSIDNFITKIFLPDYIEAGVKLGQGIPVLGDWNGDGNQTVLFWAPVNCGYEEVGTINSNSDHRLGKLYQWGAGDTSLPYKYNGSPVVAREIYYDTSTPSPWYDGNVIEGTTSDKWNNNQGPCPDGWRLPTSLEFKVLCSGKNGSYGWGDRGTYAEQTNTYPGAEFFGANSDKTAETGVFFPAAGYCDGGGTTHARGSIGYYWSSTLDSYYSSYYSSHDAYHLYFNSSRLLPQGDGYRACGSYVRCVTGNGDPQGEVHLPATLATTAVSEITAFSAVCGGNITSEGDATITECGVCYSTNSVPTIIDSKVNTTNTGLGSFKCNLTNLTDNTKFYARAYVMNKYGVYYGSVEAFTTLETPSTPDYFENGVNLGKGIVVHGDWDLDASTPNTILYWAPVNCGYEDKGIVNTGSDHRLGKLYQWGAGDSSLPYMYGGSPVVAREMYYDTATPYPWYNYNVIDGTTSDKWNNNQGPCPEGWRLPTSLEFEVLYGSYGWVSEGTYAGQTNTYVGTELFGANTDKTAGKGVFFPAAGYRDDNGWAWGRESHAYGRYWSSTPKPDNSSRASHLYFNEHVSPQDYSYRAFASSVRCVSGDGDPNGVVHKPAVLTTITASAITATSAICGGNVISEGDATVTERGVCYSTTRTPTIEDSKVKDSGTGLGVFACTLIGLSEYTKYYVRTYVVNKSGTYYGGVETFATLFQGPRPDYNEGDNNLGQGIPVLGDWNGDGNQTVLFWAPVNCGYEEVGTINSNSDHRLGKLYQWGAGDTSLPYKYNGSPVVAREMYYDTATPSPWYGWNEIYGTTSDKWNNNQGPCPEGWRLPTSLEFEVLYGSYGWVDKGTYAGQTDTYPGAEFFGANSDKTVGKGVFFPAAGYRDIEDGSAYYRGLLGIYWSSTPDRSTSHSAEYIYFYSSDLYPHSYFNRAYCFSVRCVSEGQ